MHFRNAASCTSACQAPWERTSAAPSPIPAASASIAVAKRTRGARTSRSTLGTVRAETPEISFGVERGIVARTVVGIVDFAVQPRTRSLGARVVRVDVFGGYRDVDAGG